MSQPNPDPAPLAFRRVPTSDQAVAEGLRRITRAARDAGFPTAEGLLGGPDGYGATVRTAVFDMLPYCWCEQDGCVMCAGCECPEDAWTYFIDGAPVAAEAFYSTGGHGGPGQRTVTHVPVCDVCQGVVVVPANFTHHRSGTTVTWYKYIGRGMTADVRADWDVVVQECVTELISGAAAGKAPDGLR